MKKLSQLDFFRFLASIIVIFLHQGKNTTWYNSLPSIFHQGQLMVLFFFVLSGFVLTYRYYDEEINLKNFYFSRFKKLLPMYYFSLFIFYILKPIPFKNTVFSILGIQSLFPSKGLLMNYPTWALSVEFIFIILFPFIIKQVKKISVIKFLIITVLYSIIVYSLYLTLVPYYENIYIREFLIYNPLIHLPVFLLGILTYFFYKNSKQNNNTFKISIIILFISFIVNFSNKHHPLYIILGGYFFSFLIYYLSTDNGIFSNILSKKIFVQLGSLSYFLFLFHIPIAYFFIRFFKFNFSNNQFLIYLISVILFSKTLIILQNKLI